MKRAHTVSPAPKSSAPGPTLAQQIRAKIVTVLEQTKVLSQVDLQEVAYAYTVPFEGFGSKTFKQGWVTLKLPHRDGEDAPWTHDRIPQTYEAPSDAECFAAVLHAIVEELKYQQQGAERLAQEEERQIAELERRLTAARQGLQRERERSVQLVERITALESFVAGLTP